MSNITTGLVWTLDTAGTGSITTDLVRPGRFRYVGVSGTTGGDAVVVTDTAGKVYWATVATGPYYTEDKNFEIRPGMLGLKVPTLASGKLYIEFN